MSSLRPEYIRAVQKSAFDTTFGVLSKTFDGIEKLVELNVHTVKSTLGESQERLAEFLSTQQPHTLFAQHVNLAQTALKMAPVYWSPACKVVAETQAELLTFAQAQFRQYRHDAQAFVDSVAQDVPAESGTAEAAWAFPKSPVESPKTTSQA
ncbi:TIGR01841 family phasin [Paraburkholderia sp. LEh10]|uniref:TIGR01841 family phasin n=1 Tax=Paraburkholderia sp. LEh10 TaxID=2821353 RepID=UPI001AEAB8DE|nr:TIGR01841 family phasin [Paraburkholderia sp. LEh10]MBP0596101.1 TIGR01841 family phasin [Paraburkholderia sp. LEh10]